VTEHFKHVKGAFTLYCGGEDIEIADGYDLS